MSATGRVISLGGTATLTETRVAIPAAYKKGYPNSNPAAGVQTYPTPQKSSQFLKNLRIYNSDPTNNLLVRLNNNSAQNTIKPGGELKYEFGIVHDITVQASVAPVTWDGNAVSST
jgi:hypothetical protein